MKFFVILAKQEGLISAEKISAPCGGPIDAHYLQGDGLHNLKVGASVAALDRLRPFAACAASITAARIANGKKLMLQDQSAVGRNGAS